LLSYFLSKTGSTKTEKEEEMQCPTHQGRWLFLIGATIFSAGIAYASAAAINDPKCALTISEGDIAYKNFDNAAALTSYRRAREIDSSNYEALWKLTRAHIDVGTSLPKNQQLQYYVFGEKLARQCVAFHPDSAEGHFFLAVALGRVALHQGGKRKIQIAKEVKAEAERTLQCNPGHDGAIHVLGRWNYELADLNFIERAVAKIVFGGLPTGASYQQAAQYFEQAIAHRPEAPVHHLEYGRTLLKLDRIPEARQQLERCVELPEFFWDDAQHKRAARKLLNKLGKP
jgi:tetratricopeptide (TPR) repeat protein